MTRLSIRIDFEPAGALGPGMIQLLERVAEHGSIRQAALSMTMSYRKAWLLIQTMQETFGGEIVTSAAGGPSGGGTRLTPLGMQLLASYRRILKAAARAARGDLKMLSALVRPGGGPGSLIRKKRQRKSLKS